MSASSLRLARSSFTSNYFSTLLRVGTTLQGNTIVHALPRRTPGLPSVPESRSEGFLHANCDNNARDKRDGGDKPDRSVNAECVGRDARQQGAHRVP